MKRNPNHFDVYSFIVKHEKLLDEELMDKLQMEFIFERGVDRCCLSDLIRCTRNTRPAVIRMGPVPVTNWCMRG